MKHKSCKTFILCVVFFVMLTGCLSVRKASSPESIFPVAKTSTTTSTPFVPTVTLTPLPTQVLATRTPTQTPIPTEEQSITDFLDVGYQVVTTGTITSTTSGNFIMFGLMNPSITLSGMGDIKTPDVCKVLVYKGEDQLLAAFDAPESPEDGRLSTNGHFTTYPVSCRLVNWNDISTSLQAEPDTYVLWNYSEYENEYREEINAVNFASDINQNGYPEFAISTFYCPWADYDPERCSSGDMVLHFYEIQEDSVKHITSDLPGVISPYQIIHSKEQNTIFVSDISYEYINRGISDSYWVYQWNGTTYENVTLQYLDEYKILAASYITEVVSEYGNPLTDANSLGIALDILTATSIYRRIEMNEEATGLFFELSDPANWPGTSLHYLCWLEFFRAQAQSELEKQIPFSFPVYSDFDDGTFSVEQYLQENPEMAIHDLSTCQAVYP